LLFREGLFDGPELVVAGVLASVLLREGLFDGPELVVAGVLACGRFDVAGAEDLARSVV